MFSQIRANNPSDVFITSICVLHRNTFPRKKERMSKVKLIERLYYNYRTKETTIRSLFVCG
eukprot:COSAG02_NODE_1082_length_14704_cov_49.941664_13_plen_61_part_00